MSKPSAFVPKPVLESSHVELIELGIILCMLTLKVGEHRAESLRAVIFGCRGVV